VREAGDGTTTAIVLAESLMKEANCVKSVKTVRQIKQGIDSALKKVNKYLDSKSIQVKGDMLDSVASISCNNDTTLGKTIAKAYNIVGKNGVVLMEESEDNNTYVESVDGVQIECGLTSNYFVTDKDRETAVLENPLVLIVSSEITSIRKIQSILEYVIKNKRALLIVAPVAQQVQTALMMNKVKGNINVNIIDPPGFGPYKNDTIDDLAILTGAKVINEELGDDLDLIQTDCLGEALTSVTDSKNTVLKIKDLNHDVEDRITEVEKKIEKEKDGFLKKKLQDRLSILSGSVGIVKVGADSKVEMKEKKDRVEDAIYAVKAALKEGIISGGGIALLNASQKITPSNECENILLRAIRAPYETILENASIEDSVEPLRQGWGFDVVSGGHVNMVKGGIIDPVLVTKTALKNAVSVVSTIISADCVISNMRTNEGN